MTPTERVVLLDDDGGVIGSAEKADVHHAQTPLHLAFSCYLLDPNGALLVTRRALAKRSWPGVWTNSFCGHPEPEEDMHAAVSRRARQELNVGIGSIEVLLPDFRYRAVDASGVVENELCPVFLARTEDPVAPEASEVAEWEWVSPRLLLASVACTPFAFSPWLRRQLPQLVASEAFPTEHASG